ncbi:NAD(P)/FAD-dependent oxidoreductase [Paenibacillus sp. JSM ZJ436]|uniref:NAD(P)/FAD-dependent oxidoreductase n=1 Tax=Paenibacillus sp. JSM ZJ436 TaxID=3376190 RepID=UPI0037896BC0
MKLTSGPSPWEQEFNNTYPSYPQLEDSVTCDVLVIGGGISGALVSYELTKRGLDVLLLEEHTVAGGSTSASTALLQFMNDDSITELMKRFGEYKGSRFYKMCLEAVERLASVASQLPEDIGFRRRSSLYCASTRQDVKLLQQEYENLRRYGFDVEYWTPQDIAARFPFTKPAALYCHGDAEVNPVHMVKALLNYSHIRQGLRIYEHSGVVRVEEDHLGRAIAYTHGMGKVHAKTLIWTVGYEAQDWKKDAQAVLEYTYAITTEPVEDLSSWHERALIWEAARPYLYLRTTVDGRIVAGGLDEPLAEGGLTEEIVQERSRKLLKEVMALFPQLGPLNIECSWSGVFGSTKDGLPLIGRDPRFPSSYFVEGYGGNGTVYSMIAADMLADTLTGKEPEELSWFSPIRRKQKH